ncbi:hypothetical protein [Oceanobacillus kimchii]|uniref:hypothetical protein n=1 Tax=Oceanobacillus kimchii TaxID=746691 RepID=UPI00232B76E3|nr:hypothetical protein [Oceanobacillus kimchii]
MTKSFLEKRDLKSLTVLSALAAIQQLNKDLEDDNKRNNIVFFTSFGSVMAKDIVSSDFNEDELTKENYQRFISQTSVSNAKEALIEHGNEDVLLNQTAFVLTDVQVKSHGDPYNIPSMILFSDQIVGVSFGNFQEN